MNKVDKGATEKRGEGGKDGVGGRDRWSKGGGREETRKVKWTNKAKEKRHIRKEKKEKEADLGVYMVSVYGYTDSK
jgi:hypothetical protein